MKKLKYLSLITAVLMLFSAGCNVSVKTGDPSLNPVDTETVLPKPQESEPVDYAEDYFVFNGESDYVIVIPRDYGADELLGAQEINTFLLKSCGTTLEIKYDDQVTYTAESKFISVGNNGFLLKTVGSSVFIAGATKVGTGALYGVYEFLSYQIGWKCYAHDEYYYNVFRSVKLVDVNVTDKPDIPGFMLSGYVSARSDLRKRLRISERTEVLGKGDVSPYHNMLLWLPASRYYSEHPKWYNSKQTQLCLTCHGDQEEYNLMMQTAFENMWTEVMTYDLDVVTWTLMDNWDPCDCQACREARAEYGARSGQLVKTCNEFSEMFEERFRAEGIDKDISVLFFAYYYYTEPPTSGIKCRDNVYPIIAPYNEMDRAASIYSDKNANIKNIIDSWSNLCKKFGFWIYSVNFGGTYLFPFDPFTCMQENYSYFASKNPFYMYDEGFSTQFQESVPGFGALKDYLSANIAWNTDSDVADMTAEFFSAYYKDAAEEMYRYYLEYRMKLQMLFDDYDYSHSLNMDCLKQEYFEFGTLLSWKNRIEKAYSTIAKYAEKDAELYKKLDSRIRTESIMINYMIWKLYGSYYTNAEQQAMVNEIYNDSVAVGLVTGSHWKSIRITLGLD